MHHEEGLPLLVLLLIFVINIILKLNKPNPDPNRTLLMAGNGNTLCFIIYKYDDCSGKECMLFLGYESNVKCNTMRIS